MNDIEINHFLELLDVLEQYLNRKTNCKYFGMDPYNYSTNHEPRFIPFSDHDLLTKIATMKNDLYSTPNRIPKIREIVENLREEKIKTLEDRIKRLESILSDIKL